MPDENDDKPTVIFVEREPLRDVTYLGDGLYAGFDGWMITLYADRPEGRHWVALELDVLNNLNRFAEKYWPRRPTPPSPDSGQ